MWISSTNKTDRHDITEILLKVALNTIKQTNKQTTSFELYRLNTAVKINSKSNVSILTSILQNHFI